MNISKISPLPDISRLSHYSLARCGIRTDQLWHFWVLSLEHMLNEMPGVLAVFNLDEAPHYSTFCRWEQDHRMCELRRLLRASAEQAGWSGEAAIDASGATRTDGWLKHPIRQRSARSAIPCEHSGCIGSSVKLSSSSPL